MTQAEDRSGAWSAALVLSAAVLVGYGMTLRAPLIYDDVSFIRDNPLFHLPFSVFLSRIFSARYFYVTQAASDAPLATWQPLVALAHYPFAGHLAALRLLGLAFHAANAFGVWALARRLGAEGRGALLAGLLFALFPASTEAVDFVSFKGHVLTASFVLLCLNAHGRGRPALAHAAFALALLSKETAAAGLPILLAWEFLVERRPPAEAARRLWGYALLLAVYFGLRFVWLDAAPPLPGWAPTARLGGLSFAWYLRLLLWPWPLCLERTLPGGLAVWLGWLAPLLFIGVLARLRRDPLAAFGLAWFGAALLPMLHLMPFANLSPVADRYLYMASAGACLLSAHGAFSGAWAWARWALLLAWGCLTLVRNGMYLDSEALFRQAAACAPANPRPWLLLGIEQYAAGRPQEALGAFEKAYALDPTFPQTLNNLAGAHLALGQFDKAEAILRELVRREPGVAQWRDNLEAVQHAQAQAKGPK